jgi:RNA polymerase sigma-70 factor (ECF subfamily)
MPRTGPAPLPSDEELARQAQQGCAASWEELLRRFQAPVLHFLRQRGGAADAEDLLQDTFVRVYANLHRYRRRWLVATWIFTIARRVSINHHRRTRPQGDAQVLQGAVSAAPGPVEAAVEEENRRYLWGMAAQMLSDEELTALWLHYVEDLPLREVAAVLGRSWVAVKTMLFRARRRLLPRLRELAPEGPPRRVAQARGRSPALSAVTAEVPDV